MIHLHSDPYRIKWLAKSLLTWRSFNLVGHVYPCLYVWFRFNKHKARPVGKS